MRSLALNSLIFSALSIAVHASAATLKITPDPQTHHVGETITLSVVGDSEGAQDNAIFGRILFDPQLAEFVSATQDRREQHPLGFLRSHRRAGWERDDRPEPATGLLVALGLVAIARARRAENR